VTLLNVLTGEIETLDGIDAVIVAGHYKANDALYKELKSVIGEVHAIGDCVAPRRIEIAIYEGENIGRSL
jgi:predicted nucleic acid-binding Zn finger protein